MSYRHHLQNDTVAIIINYTVNNYRPGKVFNMKALGGGSWLR